MKKLALITMLFLSGCGLQNQMDDAKKDIQALEDAAAADAQREYFQNVRIQDLEAQVDYAIQTLIAVVDTVSQLQTGSAALNAMAAALQAQITAQQAQLAQLQTHESIVEFIDPCGPGSGFQEVLLRTSTGKLVAYFESGGTRFLSVLTSGSYRTTDAQACNFTVNAAGKVCDSLECR